MTPKYFTTTLFLLILCMLTIAPPASAETQADTLVSSSEVGYIYEGDVFPNVVTSLSLCPAGYTSVANAPRWNGFAYYYSDGTLGWKSVTGYIQSSYTVPAVPGYTRFAPTVVCLGSGGHAQWIPLTGGYYTFQTGQRPVNTTPTVLISGLPSTAYIGDTVSYTVTASGTPTPTITAQEKDPSGSSVTVSPITSGESNSMVLTSAGIYQVYAWATNSAGQAADMKEILVLEIPTPTPSEIPTPTPTITIPTPSWTQTQIIPVTTKNFTVAEISTIAPVEWNKTAERENMTAIVGDLLNPYFNTVDSFSSNVELTITSFLSLTDWMIQAVIDLLNPIVTMISDIIVECVQWASVPLQLMRLALDNTPAGIQALLIYGISLEFCIYLLRGET